MYEPLFFLEIRKQLLDRTIQDLYTGFLKMTQYAVLVIVLILVELGCAAFIFFDKSWEDVSVMLIVSVVGHI